MELLVNDLSLHGQFSDVAEFQAAIQRVMSIRSTATRFGHALYCHRNLAQKQVTPSLGFQQAIQRFNRNEQRSVMQWITQQGPFWEDAQEHSEDDYLDWNDEIVTGTAVGEAAYCCHIGIERQLVSLQPSRWLITPVPVTWTPLVGSARRIEVTNHWEPQTFETTLESLPATVASWAQLAEAAIARYQNIEVYAESFEPLRGYPFYESAARRILALLDTLNRFKVCFDSTGQRTPQGHEIYQTYFTGNKSAFSPSSETEEREFRQELTFPHPDKTSETLFCTWHGKVKTPQLRIHFSWPITANDPLYVLYVGPKITKR